MEAQSQIPDENEVREAVEVNLAKEEQPSSAILSQRAIIASEVFWDVGIGDFSRGDPRSSRRMEP